jgi:GNAT superfamily N-acetyltransferase
MNKQGHAVFVAILNGFDIVGWIHLMPRRLIYLPLNAEIGGIVVHREHRRKGIGRSLINFAESWAKEQVFANIVVRSDMARKESHGFYRAIGYSIIKTQNVYTKEIAGQQKTSPENQGGAALSD